MIGRLAKSGLEQYITAAAEAMREQGAKPDSHLVRKMLNAWQTILCQDFAAQMRGVNGKNNLFAKLEFGSGEKIGIALVFGEGEILDAVAEAFKDVPDQGEEDELDDEGFDDDDEDEE